MFIRDKSDPRRVVIVDVSHLFYAVAYGNMPRLTASIMVGGQLMVVDTTMAYGVIRLIHSWSEGGSNPVVVCFDGEGCTRSRKAYFARKNGVDADANPVGYKGSRESKDSRFYEGMNLTMNLLLDGKVCCLKGEGYEADDLVMAAVQKAKVEYPGLPIDVITGDTDLVPLVDDQVSVWLRSRKSTYAEQGVTEKPHYYQLRPYNMQSYMEGLTSYKGLSLPYNSVLLAKLLRGDKADEIPGYPKFTPMKYNKLVTSLIEAGYDFDTLFRYGAPSATVCYRGSEEPIPEGLIVSVPKEQKMVKFGEVPQLTELCRVLGEYLDSPVIDHVRFVYNGINLNGAFTGLPEKYNRRPVVIKSEIKGYLQSELQQSVSKVNIRLKVW